MSLHTYNTVRKLGYNLVERMNEVAFSRNITSLQINSNDLKTKVKPCQHHQRNIFLDAISITISKYLITFL